MNVLMRVDNDDNKKRFKYVSWWPTKKNEKAKEDVNKDNKTNLNKWNLSKDLSKDRLENKNKMYVVDPA